MKVLQNSAHFQCVVVIPSIYVSRQQHLYPVSDGSSFSFPSIDPSFLFKVLLMFRSILLKDHLFAAVRTYVFNLYVTVDDIILL